MAALKSRISKDAGVIFPIKGAVCQPPTHTNVSQLARHPPQPTGRLGVAAMAPAVQRYFQEGLATSTRRTYNAAMKRFHTFCSLFDIHSPFPITEHLLCSFAAHYHRPSRVTGSPSLSPQGTTGGGLRSYCCPAMGCTRLTEATGRPRVPNM